MLRAKLHVATGQFSFIEIDIEAETAKEIVEKNDALLKHYKDVSK